MLTLNDDCLVEVLMYLTQRDHLNVSQLSFNVNLNGDPYTESKVLNVAFDALAFMK